ncbi:hypothetical protein [Okeania sp.]|uniref:hypothetical protein n=1 Tax=Okeania sp. TaxID=3100323 RepID=UPI002B4AB208|nr:hypothetical protein [Okeania sp.]MEB3343671.1 hypothetical protein [Okeania sp.]
MKIKHYLSPILVAIGLLVVKTPAYAQGIPDATLLSFCTRVTDNFKRAVDAYRFNISNGGVNITIPYDYDLGINGDYGTIDTVTLRERELEEYLYINCDQELINHGKITVTQIESDTNVKVADVLAEIRSYQNKNYGVREPEIETGKVEKAQRNNQNQYLSQAEPEKSNQYNIYNNYDSNRAKLEAAKLVITECNSATSALIIFPRDEKICVQPIGPLKVGKRYYFNLNTGQIVKIRPW